MAFGQHRVFTTTGGHRLGQWQRAFSPRQLRGLGQDDGSIYDPVTGTYDGGGGIIGTLPGVTSPYPTVPIYSPTQTGSYGAPLICLDQNQNSIGCSSANCTYGDCGSSGPQQTVGSLCLNQQENAVACSDPNCTFGDCISGTKPPGATLTPGPSPRVNAPLTMFPATAPPTATPQPYWGAQATSWLTQIEPYIPIILVILVLGSFTGGAATGARYGRK
jgi:hypothetical protein